MYSNQYVVKVGDEYVVPHNSEETKTTWDILEASLYGYDTAVEIAHEVGGEVLPYTVE